MSKIKLVMFEGADKVGKTTLFRLYRAATHYIPLAIDRFTASNYVYDKYYKRDTSDEEYLRSEIRLQDIFDCYLVVLTASEEELRERIAVNERGSALEVALDNLINIFCLFVFLFGSGQYINSKTRFIDIVNTILISRIAFYLFILIPKPDNEVTKKVMQNNFNQISNFDVSLLILGGIMTLLGLVWYITLLYTGFKTATNAKKMLPIILFVASILLSEILSKILIHYFN